MPQVFAIICSFTLEFYFTNYAYRESIDTTTSAGKMMMQIVGVFAEFERGMLKERTLKGLQYAREQGRIGVLNRN